MHDELHYSLKNDNKFRKVLEKKLNENLNYLELGTVNFSNKEWDKSDVIRDIKDFKELADEKKKCDKKLLEELEKIESAPKGFRWALTTCPDNPRKDCFYLEPYY